MRNILKRCPSYATKPTLRERLAATKARAGKALRRSKATAEPEAEVADRTALVCYATWLDLERRRVCHDLYPHLGDRATAFRVGLNAGEDWHFTAPDARGGDADRGPVSPRAVAVLDLVGVDWRGDKAKGRGPDDVARDLAMDTGERPELPPGWPSPDAGLVTAAGDALRLDRAIDALCQGDSRDMDEIPGYVGLDEARADVQATLVLGRATSLAELQAKASGFDLPSQKGHERWLAELGASLARDLLRGTNRLVEPVPDPIFAAIEEAKRLDGAWDAARAVPQPQGDINPLPGQEEAQDAFYAHINDVLLQTVPRTAAGCAALCRYALAYHDANGIALDETPDNREHYRILDLIARSPLL